MRNNQERYRAAFVISSALLMLALITIPSMLIVIYS